jgi:hypothetical protein
MQVSHNLADDISLPAPRVHAVLEPYLRRASEAVEAVADDPDGRIALRRRFYERYGFATDGGLGFGNSELAFMAWLADRGALNPLEGARPGSPWWRTLNQDYLITSELAGLIVNAAVPVEALTFELRLWLEYLRAPCARSWYRAHNACVVRAMFRHDGLAGREPSLEQRFINVALSRLLYAQALAEGAPLMLRTVGRRLVDPRYPLVDLLLATPFFYPRRYPITEAELIQATTAVPARGYERVLGMARLFDRVVSSQLPALYRQAALWLQTPELALLVDGSGVPIYPRRASPSATLPSWRARFIP